jgi:hypothetical protein|tara:strand:+ start:3299 stop:5521 length:2223 start_codon:yes stop_codon:yes gene_type:complete
MIPTSSSATTNGCDNISSNCVIWQGPDIACINLCNGDTISEVVAKLAKEVCDLITNGVAANPSLTGLDLDCLNIQGVTPTELVPVLQAMIVQICTNTTSTVKTTANTLLTLPACLEYDDANGNAVTQLPINEFAIKTAQQVCKNYNSILAIQVIQNSYGVRLNAIEACVFIDGVCQVGSAAEQSIIPAACVIPGGQLTAVSVVVQALQVKYCALESAVGLPAAINLAISQSVITASYDTLTNKSVSYGSIVGWNTSPINLSQTMQNAWVVIDDMYSAITNIQNNCCPTGCDSVTFGYVLTNILTNGEISALNFNFESSTIPAAFNDCAGSTVLTITDATNNTITQTVSVSSLQNNAGGVQVSLPTLNTNQDLSVSVAFCFTDGSDTCRDTILKTVTGVVPCPAAITMSAISSSTATVNFVNLIGATATYVIDILDGSTVSATHTINNPGANIVYTFTGLVPSTAYTTRVTVTMGGTTTVCANTIGFETASAALSCDAGMDVAFLFDYTGSMGPVIETIKTGITSIINTIITEASPGDYRLALGLADEGNNATPTYATSTDYLALPAAQRIINVGSSIYQYMTAVEKFALNNTTTFQAQLAKINTGNTLPADWPLGYGVGVPEPVDMLIGLTVEANAFLGTLRPAAAKYLVIFTDALPSGTDDIFDATDVARLNSLAITCATAGIKCFILGEGVNGTYTSGGVTTYPWRTFSISTGGNWNNSYNAATVISEIVDACTPAAP